MEVLHDLLQIQDDSMQIAMKVIQQIAQNTQKIDALERERAGVQSAALESEFNYLINTLLTKTIDLKDELEAVTTHIRLSKRKVKDILHPKVCHIEPKYTLKGIGELQYREYEGYEVICDPNAPTTQQLTEVRQLLTSLSEEDVSWRNHVKSQRSIRKEARQQLEQYQKDISTKGWSEISQNHWESRKLDAEYSIKLVAQRLDINDKQEKALRTKLNELSSKR